MTSVPAAILGGSLQIAASTIRIPGAPDKVRFISPLGKHFCESCNCLRLTADGQLRPCLWQDIEISLQEALSGEKSRLHTLQRAIRLKLKSHQVLARYVAEYRRMAQIGG